MNSKIHIGLRQGDNSAAIKMIVRETDDIRDQLCQQFVENLQGSTLVRVYHSVQGGDDTDTRYVVELSPIPKMLGSNVTEPEILVLIHGMTFAICKNLGIDILSACVTGDEIFWHIQDKPKRTPYLGLYRLAQLSDSDLYQTLYEVFNHTKNWVSTKHANA